MRTILCAFLVALGLAVVVSADSWSYWSYVNGDVNLKYRQKVNTYGTDINPDCELEIHNESGIARSTRVDISYSFPGGSNTKTMTEYFDSDTQVAVDSVDPCSRIYSVTAVRTDRR